MKSLLRAFALLAVASLASGCVIYFGDDTGDDCAYEEQPDYWLGYRNPETGACENWGGGGGCYGGPAFDQAFPDWASCPGACEGLDEGVCLVTSGCRGAYLDTCPPDADCDESAVEFLECWGTAPSGPILTENCYGLDAYECSRSDECAAIYTRGWDAMTFSHCAPEAWSQGCYSDGDCPAGYDCTSDTECLPPPGCGPGDDCPAVCYGRCVPDAPSCGDGNECPPDSHCETWCTGGGDCTPGGDCPPPECWSECVPDGPDPEACETLASEEACAARADCTAVYDGFGCTCYPDGSCTCEEWVYSRCEGGGDVPVPF